VRAWEEAGPAAILTAFELLAPAPQRDVWGQIVDG
jgi:hypothetical protein